MTSLCVKVECVFYLYCEVPVCPRVNVCTSTVVYMVAGCLWVLLARECQHISVTYTSMCGVCAQAGHCE